MQYHHLSEPSYRTEAILDESSYMLIAPIIDDYPRVETFGTVTGATVAMQGPHVSRVFTVGANQQWKLDTGKWEFQLASEQHHMLTLDSNGGYNDPHTLAPGEYSISPRTTRWTPLAADQYAFYANGLIVVIVPGTSLRELPLPPGTTQVRCTSYMEIR